MSRSHSTDQDDHHHHHEPSPAPAPAPEQQKPSSHAFVFPHRRPKSPQSRSMSPSRQFNINDRSFDLEIGNGYTDPSLITSLSQSPSPAAPISVPPHHPLPPTNLSHSRQISLKWPPHSAMSSTNTNASSSTPTTTGSTPHSRPSTPQVLETSIVEKEIDPTTGNKLINNYEILGEIGRGVHGKVKLGRDLETAEYVAIKVVVKQSRKRLGKVDFDAGENKVRREIAIMKKCVHPNVVRLKEVMDDPMSKKIYLVLEYMQGGEIIWRTRDDKPALTIDQARRVFRDVVLGLEYLHFNGIIHRDIKPANLLWSQDHSVKISDFGVSHVSAQTPAGHDDDVELAKTAGSPAFLAPELCWTLLDKPRPPITPAIDIWALGVTLCCLLYARLPFTGENEFVLFKHICETPLSIPQTPQQSPETLNLLKRLLKKLPGDRITLPEIKRHPFVLHGLPNPTEWVESTDPRRLGDALDATPDEIAGAFSIVDRLKRKLWKLGVGLGLTSLVGGVGASVRRRATTSRLQPPGHLAKTAPTTPSVESNIIQNQRRSMILSSSPVRRGSASSRDNESDQHNLEVAPIEQEQYQSRVRPQPAPPYVRMKSTDHVPHSELSSGTSIDHSNTRSTPQNTVRGAIFATPQGLPRLRAMSDLSSSNLLKVQGQNDSFAIPRVCSFEQCPSPSQESGDLISQEDESQVGKVSERTTNKSEHSSRQSSGNTSRLNIPRKLSDDSVSSDDPDARDDDGDGEYGFYIKTDKPRGRIL